MKGILDDGPDNRQRNKAKDQLLQQQIHEIESKNWYGVVLICIVIALIIISTLLHTLTFGFNVFLVIINTLLISMHLIALYLAQSDKLLAYSAALLLFFVFIVSHFLITNILMLKSIFWDLAIIGAYCIFIYEEVKLKKLKTKINH